VIREKQKTTAARYGVSFGDTRHCGPGWLSLRDIVRDPTREIKGKFSLAQDFFVTQIFFAQFSRVFL
jgi:hypothetical protein